MAKSLTLTEDSFGSALDPFSQKVLPVRRFTFANQRDTLIQVISLGATVTSMKTADKSGNLEDIVMGYDTITQYLDDKINPYFGATVGQVANRIGNGKFKLDGVDYQLSQNFQGRHTLHGGFVGFNKANWTVQELDTKNCVLVLQHVSPDMHEGFPGEVTARARFQLFPDCSFAIKFTATTTKPTPINMTNHSYFNLAGHNAGREALYEHLIAINADKITVTDEDSIPTGHFSEVKDTAFDFKELRALGQQMAKTSGKGFDDNYCCNVDGKRLTLVARALHRGTGRYMELSTDQPGMQFYTGNFLPNTSNGEQPFPGKEGAKYERQGAFCFEPQGYPDAVNHANFPNTIVRPGETYEHNILYKFGVTQNLEKDQWLCKF